MSDGKSPMGYWVPDWVLTWAVGTPLWDLNDKKERLLEDHGKNMQEGENWLAKGKENVLCVWDKTEERSKR